mmetsp:Transcript_9275/g.27912  ORF Transcript_9275/g.27912 Transcript_9275/m.27912 type:complete len:321 (+) Transcript_9275:1786-2748(+)
MSHAVGWLRNCVLAHVECGSVRRALGPDLDNALFVRSDNGGSELRSQSHSARVVIPYVGGEERRDSKYLIAAAFHDLRKYRPKVGGSSNVSPFKHLCVREVVHPLRAVGVVHSTDEVTRRLHRQGLALGPKSADSGHLIARDGSMYGGSRQPKMWHRVHRTPDFAVSPLLLGADHGQIELCYLGEARARLHDGLDVGAEVLRAAQRNLRLQKDLPLDEVVVCMDGKIQHFRPVRRVSGVHLVQRLYQVQELIELGIQLRPRILRVPALVFLLRLRRRAPSQATSLRRPLTAVLLLLSALLPISSAILAPRAPLRALTHLP